MFIKTLDISAFRQNPQDFCVVDIRGKQAFLGAHLCDSLNASDEKQIILILSKMSKSILPPPINR